MSRRQWLLALAGLLAGSGCAASRKVPAGYLTGKRAILIIPMASPPIKVPSASAIVYGDANPLAGGFLGVALATAMLAALPKAKKTQEAATHDLERWKGGATWQSAAVLAEVLARKLSAGGRWRVPVGPVHSAPEKRWPNSGGYVDPALGIPKHKGSIVSPSEVRKHAADLVLELAAAHELFSNADLTLTVSVRLVDPVTGAGAGWAGTQKREILPYRLTEMFDNEGAEFRAAFLKLGNECLDECLERLGLRPQ